jgi:hypothetical protein
LIQGRIWGWGDNSHGALGQSSDIAKLDLPSALGDLAARSVAAGAYHSLAVDLAGTVLAWGGNQNGQLGNGELQDQYQPQPVLADAVAVAAGAFHSVALRSDGSVWTWGRNLEGQLGRLPTYEVYPKPEPVFGLPPIHGIAASAFATLAIDEKGQVWQWGQLDPASGPAQPFPARIHDLAGVRQVVAGRGHALALGANGELLAWGSNSHGQLGQGEPRWLVAYGESFEVSHDYEYDYHTNITTRVVTENQWIERQVTNDVPVYRWWQRYSLTVVDYAADPAAPLVRPALDLPGALEGIAQNGSLLYTVGRRPDTTSTVNEQDVLQVSAYDGTKIFLGDSRVIANTISNETALVRVLADGRLAVASGGWNEGTERRIELLRIDNARFATTGSATLPSVPQSTSVLGDFLVVRDALGILLFEVAGATPARLGAIDIGCIGLDLERVTGNPSMGVWAPASDYGAIRLGPQ